MDWDVADIEDLHKQAERHKFCPYYAQKDRVSSADLVFMPYNYLIDEKIRENFEINFENTILIFDEGHNISQCSEDVASFEVKSKHLDQCLTELHSLQESRA